MIPEGFKQAVLKAHDYCLVDSKADINHLRACRVNHIPDEPTSKCYLACMTEQIELNIMEGIAIVQDVVHFLNEDIMTMAMEMKSKCDHLGES